MTGTGKGREGQGRNRDLAHAFDLSATTCVSCSANSNSRSSCAISSCLSPESPLLPCLGGSDKQYLEYIIDLLHCSRTHITIAHLSEDRAAIIRVDTNISHLPTFLTETTKWFFKTFHGGDLSPARDLIGSNMLTSRGKSNTKDGRRRRCLFFSRPTYWM
jgi:hypothetical protein